MPAMTRAKVCNTKTGKCIDDVPAIIDSGSDFTFVSRSVARNLDLPRSPGTMTAEGIGSKKVNFNKTEAAFSLKGCRSLHLKNVGVEEKRGEDVLIGSDYLNGAKVSMKYKGGSKGEYSCNEL